MNAAKSDAQLRVQRLMFAYCCATSAAALIWLVWAYHRGGFGIEKRDGLLSALVFTIYAAPVLLRPDSVYGTVREPLFRVTPGVVVAGRLVLLVSSLNVLLWPILVPGLFELVLPSIALLSALANTLHWAFRISNIFPPGDIRTWASGGLSVSRVVRLISRIFQRAPDVTYEEWSQGMEGIVRLVSDERLLHGAWVNKNRSVCTLEDYIELHAEVFVQLESERCLKAYGEQLSPKRRRAMVKFLNAMHRFNMEFNRNSSLRDPEALLSSSAWGHVRNAAIRLRNEEP